MNTNRKQGPGGWLRRWLGWKMAAVVAAAVVAALVLCTARHTVETAEVAVVANDSIDRTPEIVKSIRAIGEWEFLSIADEEMVDTVRRGLLGDDHLVRIYYGTLRLGVNLHEARPRWLRVKGDTAVATLPRIKLLDEAFIDEARTRSFAESGKWDGQAREDLYDRAARRMKGRALSPANVRSAQANADAQLRQLLRAAGYRHIIVRFDGGPRAARGKGARQ